MKVEIGKEELECLEVAIDFAIKSSAFMQFAALADPKNAPIKTKDILKANRYMADSLGFIERVKEEFNGSSKERQG